MEKRGTR